MLEMERNIFILNCTAALLVYVIHLIVTHADYRDGLLYRTGTLLLYGYLKTCITIETGKNAFHLKMKSLFSGYPLDGSASKSLQQKKLHMENLKKQLQTSQSMGSKKTDYNLKILK